jgi:hypothetical protein
MSERDIADRLAPGPDELAGPLRRVVEQLRRQPPPRDVLDRALERARLLDRPRAARRARWRVLAGAGLAAAMVLGVAVYAWRDRPTKLPGAPPAGLPPQSRPTPEVAQEQPPPRKGEVDSSSTKLGQLKEKKAEKVPAEKPGPDVAAFLPARPVAFAPGAMVLVSTGADQPIRPGQAVRGRDGQAQTLHLWDMARGGNGRRLNPGGVPEPGWAGYAIALSSLALSADGRRLALAQGGTVRVWDVASGRELYHKTSGAMALVFSPDGQVLAVQQGGGGKGTVHLWNAATGKELRHVLGQGSFLPSVAFAADGKRLATACEDNTLRLWEVATGRELLRMSRGHASTVATVAFSPDGKILASSGAEGTVVLWDLTTGKARHRLKLSDGEGPVRWASTLAFAADSAMLAAGETRGISLWDTATGRHVRTCPADSGGAVFLAFSPDGKTLASIRGPFMVRDPENGKLGVLGYSEVYPTVLLWEVASGQARYQFPPQREGATVAKPAGLWGGKATALAWGMANPPRQLAPGEMRRLWAELAGLNTAQAYRVGCTLAALPAQALPLLRTELRPVPPVKPARVMQLIDSLDDPKFRVRDKATRELENLRELAVDALARAAAEERPLEVVRRVDRLLQRLESAPVVAERRRLERAVEILEHIGSAEARRLLGELAAGAPQAWLTRAAQGALTRLDRSQEARRP